MEQVKYKQNEFQIREKIFLTRGKRDRIMISTEAPVKASKGRVPRISRMMGQVFYLERLVQQGHLKNYAEIGRMAHISTQRAAQLMNLCLLAPSIQEEILNLPEVTTGPDPISERHLRPIVSEWRLRSQVKLWVALKKERLPFLLV